METKTRKHTRAGKSHRALSASAKRRKERNMNKHITITWNDGNGEKAIIFEQNDHLDFSDFNVKVTLVGDSEVDYYVNIDPDTQKDRHAYVIDQVLGNIVEARYLPVVDDMDPEIVEVSGALGRLLQHTNIGHVFELPLEGCEDGAVNEQADHNDISFESESTMLSEGNDYHDMSLVTRLGAETNLELYLNEESGSCFVDIYLHFGKDWSKTYHAYLELDENWQVLLENPWYLENLRNDAMCQMATNKGQESFRDHIEAARRSLGLLGSFLQSIVRPDGRNVTERSSNAIDTIEKKSFPLPPSVV